MDHSDEDVDKHRMKHESDKEWCMRQAFLVAHRGKFSESRLLCLASCYINFECYGCRYPPALMHQLSELTAELPNHNDVKSGKPGSSQSIKFVPAGRGGNSSGFETFRPPDSVTSAQDRVTQKSHANKSSNSLSKRSGKLTELETSFSCLADKLSEASCSLSSSKRSETELVQIAADKARMSATTQFTELGPGKGFRCDLLIDFVLVSSSEAQNKKLAKHNTYSAAAALLRKPYLHVLEDSASDVAALKLVASDMPVVDEKSGMMQHSAPSMNAGTPLPLIQSGMKQTGHSSAQYANKRASNSVRGPLLNDFVVLQSRSAETNALQTLQQSAAFNKWSLDYDITELGSGCRCRVILGGHELADAAGQNKSTAKSAAAEQAVKLLASTSCTVFVKALGEEDLEDTLKRIEIVSGKKEETRIPDSNIGNQLLKKMGWTGGGVGKDDNRGIEEPVSIVAVVNRAGLGSGKLNDFAPAVKRVIADFVCSGGHDDLVFSPEFTSEERAVIHAEARKRHLKTRSYGSGNQRHLILSLQRTPLQLVEQLRAHGGETVKYSLLEPTTAVPLQMSLH